MRLRFSYVHLPRVQCYVNIRELSMSRELFALNQPKERIPCKIIQILAVCVCVWTDSRS